MNNVGSEVAEVAMGWVQDGVSEGGVYCPRRWVQVLSSHNVGDIVDDIWLVAHSFLRRFVDELPLSQGSPKPKGGHYFIRLRYGFNAPNGFASCPAMVMKYTRQLTIQEVVENSFCFYQEAKNMIVNIKQEFEFNHK